MNVLRGPVLWPLGPRRTVFVPDAVVAPEMPEPLPARRGDPAPERGLILPAFADWHFHWVQMGIAGKAAGKPLLQWLADLAWPAEARFHDEAAVRAIVPEALRRLMVAGTAAGAAYASPHAISAEAFLDAAPGGFHCGPAVMTAGEPAALVRPIGAWIDELRTLHARFKGRLAVSPRFGPSMDEESLAALGRFARARNLVVQTHIGESEAEVEDVKRRYHHAIDYADVYEQAGLLGPRTLLGHAIHVTDEELRRIAASGSIVVHCPASNRALGSGRMPLERLRQAGVSWVLGSDVGAAPELCMFDAMAAAVDAHEGKAPLELTDLFHRATLAGDALFGGRIDMESGLAARPGALVVPMPEGVPLSERDPGVWLQALLDRWRKERRLDARRIVPWPVV